MKQQDVLEKLERLEKLLESQEPKPLTISEAAQYLSVSKPYIYRLTSQHQISFFKPNGKKIYISKRELDNWIMKNKARTRSEMQANA